MPYSVTYTKLISSNDTPVVQPAPVELRLAVTAVTQFLDDGVFVWMKDMATGNLTYSHVASPVDLERYNYVVVGDKDFVRLKTMERRYNRADQAEAASLDIEAGIQRLCTDMQLLSDFNPAVTITVTA